MNAKAVSEKMAKLPVRNDMNLGRILGPPPGGLNGLMRPSHVQTHRKGDAVKHLLDFVVFEASSMAKSWIASTF